MESEAMGKTIDRLEIGTINRVTVIVSRLGLLFVSLFIITRRDLSFALSRIFDSVATLINTTPAFSVRLTVTPLSNFFLLIADKDAIGSFETGRLPAVF